MAFESLGYAERISINGEDQVYNSYLRVDEGGNNKYFNFVNADYMDFNFSLHPQTDPYTRPLIIDLCDYDNDLHLSIEYFSTFDGTNYHITYKAGLKDKQGEFIDPIRYTNSQGVQKTVYSISQGGFDIPALTAPSLSDIKLRYYYAETSYYNEHGLVAGDPARSVTLGGTIFTRKDIQGDVEDVAGRLDYSDWTHYVMQSIPCFNIGNDEDLEGLRGGLIDAGNGKDPYGKYDPAKNPFENDPSGPGGGTGGYKPSKDETGVPGLPSVSAIGSGFVTIYNPDSTELRSLAAELWTESFYETILKLWNDPFDGLISFNLVPFTPDTSGSDYVKMGNYTTSVTMPLVSSQYKTIDCGSVSINEFWGSALDYSPYTRAEIFLPFIGIKPINIDEIMDKTVTVIYNCDVLNGSSVCLVQCGSNVLYTFNCNVAANIPITGSNFSALWGGILKGAINATCTGAAVGGVAGGAVGAVAGGLTSAANTLASKHSEIERGSGISSSSGMLGGFNPYIILHRPIQSLPSNFTHFKGYPSNITSTLRSLSGYTEVEYIHLDGINATEEEKEEIYSLLKAGVII